MGCPGKWNPGLKQAVLWWFHFDPHPMAGFHLLKWVWVKIEPPGYGPQVLVHVCTSRASHLGYLFLTHSQMNSLWLFFSVGFEVGIDFTGRLGWVEGLTKGKLQLSCNQSESTLTRMVSCFGTPLSSSGSKLGKCDKLKAESGPKSLEKRRGFRKVQVEVLPFHQILRDQRRVEMAALFLEGTCRL